MAQLVARFHGMEEVWGSNPHSSTTEGLVSRHLDSTALDKPIESWRLSV